jgi:pimeloyl-ACP methyl ester carboxylesterase
MDDVRAVMDAAGSEKAAVYGLSEGGVMAMLFGATHPERCQAVLTFGAYACRIYHVDYPWAPTPEARQAWYDSLESSWGRPESLADIVPSKVGDSAFMEWYGAFFRAGASPAAALAMAKMNTEADVRDILPAIRVPTLVMNREEDGDVRVDEARYIASHIPGARLATFPGADHVDFVGNADAVLEGIEAGETCWRAITKRFATCCKATAGERSMRRAMDFSPRSTAQRAGFVVHRRSLALQRDRA